MAPTKFLLPLKFAHSLEKNIQPNIHESLDKDFKKVRKRACERGGGGGGGGGGERERERERERDELKHESKWCC